MIRFALNMGRVIAPRHAFAARAIEGLFRILDYFPAARDYVAQMKFKPTPRFSDGFMVPDGVGDKHTLVGRLFPQPAVVVDGGQVLLDDLLGNGFAILVRSPRADDVLPALRAAPWRQLGAHIVVLGRDAIERDAPSPRLARYGDHVILLRPDRYVAACIPVDDLARGGENVAKLIASTF